MLERITVPSLYIVFSFISLKVTAADNVSPPTRVYYVAAEDIEWDYLPEITPLYVKNKAYAAPYVDKGERRIGTRYMKSVFRGYTDSTYTTPTWRPKWLGILGPTIFAEVGDRVEINLWNNCSHFVTFHTHLAFYEKPSEGAFAFWYKRDGNYVPRGGKFKYILNIIKEYGPTESDPDCIDVGYHSHFDGDSDIVTGLVGTMIICKKGTLHKHTSSMYILLFLVYDENDSWYIDRNIKEYIGNLSDTEIQSLKSDPAFMESNRKYSINGLMYDNIPDLEVCLGSEQTWYIMGFGTEVDLHNIRYGAHTLVIGEHRNDRMHVSPGVFLTGRVPSYQLGTFSITSAISSYYLKGMQANFTVVNCNDEYEIKEPTIRGTREFYIAIEEIEWDYIPSGRNMISGQKITEDKDAKEYFFKGSCRNSTVYKKARYTEYMDKYFTKRKMCAHYMGILGPVLRVEVGEELIVTVLNKASKPFNFYSSAFTCEGCVPENEDPIPPGQSKTYKYLITEQYSPTVYDAPCVNWQYTSNVNPFDPFSGLIGILKTCRPGSLDENGYQKDVREYSLLFAVFDERKSPYYEENFESVLSNDSTCDTNSPFFARSTQIHVINGWAYGNLFGLDLCLHSNTLFNILSLHAEGQMHVVRFEGSVFTSYGVPKSTAQLTAGDHKQILLTPDALGTFKINCHINGHILTGMIALYNVIKCSACDEEHICFSGKEYYYYIAAEEVIWDYTPNMIHPVNGERLDEEKNSKPFVIRNETRIGHRYKKVMYLEYTDSTFTKLAHREEHLGILGPIIRGEICSRIHILFRNHASRPYNMQPQTLVTRYRGTVPAVEPGEEVRYTWLVPKKAGPPSNGFFSINTLYYSTVDLVRDPLSGLFGMVVIYLPGFLSPGGCLNIKGLKEFATVFTIIDENQSPYLDWNIKNFCEKPDEVNKGDQAFRNSNLMHSINGLLYGSLKGLDGDNCDVVMFYICGQGNVEKHTSHFHGLSGVSKPHNGLPYGRQEDVTEVYPGICRPVKVTFCHVGTWFFHCHVDSHMRFGMLTMINVHNTSIDCRCT